MAQTILSDQLTEGMVLAEPVMNSYGQTLIPTGAALTAHHLRVIRTWNIEAVRIQAEGETAEFVMSAQVKRVAEERLRQRITWLPRNTHEQDLFAMGVKHLAQMYSMKTGTNN